MKKLGFACLAFGALAGGHPMLADAFEPVWLTKNEMEMRTADQRSNSIQNVADTWRQIVETILPGRNG